MAHHSDNCGVGDERNRDSGRTHPAGIIVHRVSVGFMNREPRHAFLLVDRPVDGGKYGKGNTTIFTLTTVDSMS